VEKTVSFPMNTFNTEMELINDYQETMKKHASRSLTAPLSQIWKVQKLPSASSLEIEKPLQQNSGPARCHSDVMLSQHAGAPELSATSNIENMMDSSFRIDDSILSISCSLIDVAHINTNNDDEVQPVEEKDKKKESLVGSNQTLSEDKKSKHSDLLLPSWDVDYEEAFSTPLHSRICSTSSLIKLYESKSTAANRGIGFSTQRASSHHSRDSSTERCRITRGFVTSIQTLNEASENKT
jgi:hypothetical protein